MWINKKLTKVLIILTSIMLVGLVFFLPGVNAVLTDGLVSHISMDELSGNVVGDQTNHSFGGNISGAVNIVDGQIGKARSFAGNISPVIYLNQTTQYMVNASAGGFCINFWTNVTGKDANDCFYLMGGAHIYYMYDDKNAGTLNLITSTTSSVYVTGVNPPTNVKIMITTCANSSNMSIYYNGVLNNSITPATVQWVNADFTSMSMGNQNGYLQRAINGWMDEWSVWNRTLSPTEISNLYSAENGGTGFPWLTTSYSITGTISYNNTVFNGATILLLNDTTNTVIANTTSNSSGGYKFSNVLGNTLYLITAFFRNTTTYYSSSIYTNVTVLT